MRYEISKTDIDKAKIYKTDVKIPSIRETYAGPNKLSNDGQLYVNIDGNIHLYNLWKDDNDNEISINPEVLPSQNTSPNYEATHRIVLYKDTDNTYFAKPMLIGKQGDNNVYSLDVDKIDNADLNNENGFFYSETDIDITKIKDFYFNFNSILSIKIPSNAVGKINMKIMDSETSETLASAQNYFKLSGLLTDGKLGGDVVDMIKLNFSGITSADSSIVSPDTIIMEIF